jgi:hypothetical protein
MRQEITSPELRWQQNCDEQSAGCDERREWVGAVSFAGPLTAKESAGSFQTAWEISGSVRTGEL